MTYDRGADAAYIYLIGGRLRPGRAAFTYTCDPAQVKGQIQLDFDEEGRLIGIEVLAASQLLPPQALRRWRRRD